MASLFSKEEIIRRHSEMVEYGPRLTGSKAHDAFIDSIEKDLTDMGYTVESDKHTMHRWEPKKWGLKYKKQGAEVTASRVDYYPYSGCTPPEGVTAKMKYCGNKGLGLFSFLGCRGKIAVIGVPMFEAGVGLVFKKRALYPADFVPPKKQGSPVVATFVIAPLLGLAKLCGAKGVVAVMTGVSDDNAAHQYLPFIKKYAGLPAVWVVPSEGKEIMAAAKQHEEATLVMEAETFDNAPTRTIYAKLPGKSDKKTLLVNTHTDGSNAFEENAPIALLSLAKYFSEKPIEEREHTMYFSFVTGHFQLHQFGSGLFQATGKYLMKHKEFWDGKNGHALATAGVALEHLGCTEWHDTEDKKSYVKVNDVDPELVYTSNEIMSNLYLDALKGREHTRTLMLRPKNMVHFGEGQPIWKKGIPSIGLCPGPDYLCNVDPNGYIDKTNYDMFEEQIQTFAKVLETLDKKERADLGKKDGCAWGLRF